MKATTGRCFEIENVEIDRLAQRLEIAMRKNPSAMILGDYKSGSTSIDGEFDLIEIARFLLSIESQQMSQRIFE